MKKFVVIDGNAILHRAWHALPPSLTTQDGTIVNAVYGFASILLKVLQELKPGYVAVAWDTTAKTFRESGMPIIKLRARQRANYTIKFDHPGHDGAFPFPQFAVGWV